MRRNLPIGSASAAPAALRGYVHATQSPDALFQQIQATLQNNREHVEEIVGNLTNSMAAMQRQIDGNFANGLDTVIGSGSAEPEYTRAFASYMRKGDSENQLREANALGERQIIHAAMSVGDNSSGGFLAPVEYDRKIHQALRAVSPMRRLAQVVTTSVGAYSTLWNSNQFGSGWVGETAARPATTSPTFSPITCAAGEIYAMPTVTQRLLDDGAINIDSWLINSLREEFGRQEAIAFISGDGTNKPAGLLSYAPGGANDDTHPGGPLTVVEGDVAVDDLIGFMYGLAAPYRANATWLMSSATAAALTKLKDEDGNLIWRPSLMVGQPDTLLGRPVEIDEGMPAPTAGNLAVAFGDFHAGYVINDRIGIRVMRDPYTNKPYVNYYSTKRVGAGVLDPNAIRLFRIAA